MDICRYGAIHLYIYIEIYIEIYIYIYLFIIIYRYINNGYINNIIYGYFLLDIFFS